MSLQKQVENSIMQFFRLDMLQAIFQLLFETLHFYNLYIKVYTNIYKCGER